MEPRWELRPIGVVRSPVADPPAMPVGGVPAVVEIYPEFAPALADIESNTHLWVLAWLHHADRGTLQTRGRHARPGGAQRGVFGLRHASRPNPIGLMAARLLRVEGRQVHLDRLDFVDGTPVLDLKRYSPGWDAIFAARTYYETLPRDDPPDRIAAELYLEAVHFLGEPCVEAALAARLLTHILVSWTIPAKDPALRITVAPTRLADALMAVSGATVGSGRLHLEAGAAVRFQHGWQRAELHPRAQLPLEPDAILRAPESALFGVRYSTLADSV
ncbi:MAG TPA: tRNA (N6-threonylcarbamoyladenosine(37)-N6)-methyltransferase TrmO [Chloroflexota bacterium]|jgi:tRNA-Thr(GGU) m(6)t(6)A37 methyltransferase TsaA|nr:tRNA (N6-threonylcarbamoyladenosine(37)-N6)-methyltransferase TrmO [Chloroflexota bacterium]